MTVARRRPRSPPARPSPTPSTAPTCCDRTFGSHRPDLVVNQDHLAGPCQTRYSDLVGGRRVRHRAILTATDRCSEPVGYHQDDRRPVRRRRRAALTVRMAVEAGDPWIDEVAAQITSQLRQAGITVVTVPVDGTGRAGRGGRGQRLRHGPGHPHLAAPTRRHRRLVLRRTGHRGLPRVAGLEQLRRPRRSTSCSPRPPRSSTRSTGGPIYAQIDDQLWDQMVALPLFGEPGLVANGVQLANVAYNPSVDGILWNVALWTTLKPGPAGARPSSSRWPSQLASVGHHARRALPCHSPRWRDRSHFVGVAE